jgi:pimeloyl-ACP methyl ester carboxylesterase
MHPLAEAVVRHGWAAYNIEYRRVGSLGHGGWPFTFEDVDAAINALAMQPDIDTQCVVTCGHSAGGHLALWAAGTRSTGTGPHERAVPVRAAVSLAGVVDLVAAANNAVGGHAVAALMGGSPDAVPDRYALGSPAALLPLGVPQLLVHGVTDAAVPASLSEDYVRLAQSLGDEARYLPLADADHMDMIDPSGAAFDALISFLDERSP